MQDNWILAQLDDAERRLLLEGARRRPLEVGVTVLEPEAPVEGVWFPEVGVISVIVISPAGLQAEAGLVGPEGAAGLLEGLGSGTMASRGTVQAPGAAWVVPAADCRSLYGRSDTFRRVANLAAEFHDLEARQSLFCRSYHPIAARLARWLLEILDRSGQPNDTIVLTQDILAAMLAVQRTTVSTAVARLQRSKVLQVSRGRITVRDRSALETLACGCRAALAREKQRIHACAAAAPAPPPLA